MTHELKILAFWSINDKLDVSRLCAQLDGLKKDGYEGVVWHMRFYPFKKHYLSSDYMKTVNEVILYSKSIGMEFWLYDENGWPSGHANGMVKKAYPNCKIEWIAPRGKKGFAKRAKRSVNVLDKKAVDLFIKITHEAYKKSLSPEAWDYVEGFFSDEVGFLGGHGIHKVKGAVPWCKEIETRYEAEYGENPEKDFYKLFTEDESDEEFRLRYWRILTDVLADNFYKRINDWCAANGKKYTGHLKAEENSYFNVRYSGSPFKTLRQLSVPAVDALERYKSSNYFPRIASSVAKQFQDGLALTEAIGGSGFGLSPIDFYNYLDWLAECGHRKFVLHICQYCYKSHAIKDWPPAIPFSQTWQESMPEIIKALKDKYSYQELETKTLVVVPHSAVVKSYLPKGTLQHNDHNGVNVPDDLKAGEISNRFIADIEKFYGYNNNFDVTEEEIIDKEAVIENGTIKIGSQTYSEIYYSDDCYFENAQKFEGLKAIAKTFSEYFEGVKDEPVKNHIVVGMGLDDKGREKIQLAERYEGWDKEHTNGFKVSDFSSNTIQPKISKSIFGCKIELPLENAAEIGDLEIEFSDPVSALRVNGKGKKLKGDFDRFTVTVNAAELKDKLKITYCDRRRDKRKTEAFVFINGKFLVKSDAEYTPLDIHQIETTGNFYLVPATVGFDASDLITAGFPFMHDTVKVEKEIEFSKSLTLKGLKADAAKVFIDGKDYGFHYDNEFTLDCPDVEDGKHKVELVLYPSSYNKYGPHKHYEGDRHICSPGQFKKKKLGFSEWSDAPAIVHNNTYAFVKFGI